MIANGGSVRDGVFVTGAGAGGGSPRSEACDEFVTGPVTSRDEDCDDAVTRVRDELAQASARLRARMGGCPRRAPVTKIVNALARIPRAAVHACTRGRPRASRHTPDSHRSLAGGRSEGADL